MQLREDKQREDEKAEDLERHEQELKRQLLFNAGSIVNSVAADAIHQLSKRGWLEGDDGLLKSEDLYGANLQNARLGRANLRNTNLLGANLQGAFLREARLEGANLRQTKLQDAQLWEANLCGADLWCAELKGAVFEIEMIYLRQAIFDSTTILPDSSNWTPDTDMSRFTDPNHPDFWEPPWAYGDSSNTNY
jgi:hypothetical protein